MALEDYRPGRRRRPTLAWLLDWAAGILLGALVVTAVAGPASALGLDGRALLLVGGLAWAIGAGLGVWLCMGRAASYGGLALAAGMSLLATAILGAPRLLELDAGPLALVGVVGALILAPASARVGLGRARAAGS